MRDSGASSVILFKRIVAAALAAILTSCLFTSAAEEHFIPAGALAPAYYPDGGQTSGDTSLAREHYYTPAAAMAPAYFPDPGSWPEYEAGSCGTHVVYYFDKKTKILSFTIFPNVIGGGAMWDYRQPGDTTSSLPLPPWHKNGYASDIKAITFAEGVKSIGANAFYGCENVASVTISSSVNFIGPNSFYGLALTDLSFLGIAPPVLESSAFHPPEGDLPKPQSIRYPANARASYEGFLDNGAKNWSGLSGYVRAPFQDLIYVSPEDMADDTPMIHNVEYEDGAVSYRVYVQSSNSLYYAGSVVRVTYNEKYSADIKLDAGGCGYGSFPAQPGEANFSAALLSYPSTRSNRHFQIVKPGVVNMR